MTDNLYASLQITLVGVAIVFSAMSLVWGMMALLTRNGKNKQPVDENTVDQKRKAAAIAAVTAIRLAKREPLSSYHLPGTPIVSAWQLSMRTRQLKEGIKINERRS